MSKSSGFQAQALVGGSSKAAAELIELSSDSDLEDFKPHPSRKKLSLNTKKEALISTSGSQKENALQRQCEESADLQLQTTKVKPSETKPASKDAWQNLMSRMQKNEASASALNLKKKKASSSTAIKTKVTAVVRSKRTFSPASPKPKDTSSQQPKFMEKKIRSADFDSEQTCLKYDSLIANEVKTAINTVCNEAEDNISENTKGQSETEHNIKEVQSKPQTHNAPAKIPCIFLPKEERLKILKENSSKVPPDDLDFDNLSLVAGSHELSDDSMLPDTPAFNFDGNTVLLHDSRTNSSDLLKLKKPTKQCPFYKKIPGTKFSVDAFNCGDIPDIEVYFLSHFHYDHYGGLTKNFSKTLVCSYPTGNLVSMKIGLHEKHIRRLRLNKQYVIDGVEVVFLDANHCPGSVKFIFKLKNGTTYLHTGDFRYTPTMLTNPWLKSLEKVDCLYLDTTYCSPQYDFPSQSEAIRQVVQAVKIHLKTHPATLITCGSYTIGKERVFITLGEALKTKVFCAAEKRRLIGAFENKSYTNALTQYEEESCIHVLKLQDISPKPLLDYIELRKKKYTNIIGIKPSGWEFSSGKEINIRTHFKDRVKIIGVPYSEHSSFSELQEYVKATKPFKVQPTVNVGNPSKRTAMMAHIEKWLNEI